MLHVTVRPCEWFNEKENLFYTVEKPVSLDLEHSLISISKWESKNKKPFLESAKNLTTEEMLEYVKCMTVSPKNVDDIVYVSLLNQADSVKAISDYINDSMTATWFRDADDSKKKKDKQRPITSELIYYWIIKLGMPVEEFEKWHLNRLMTILRTFEEEDKAAGAKKRKPTSTDLAARKRLNEERKRKYHTRG